MIRPFAYNIPEGLSEEEAFPDEILQVLREVFQGVANAFGDNATLYRVDLGLLYASVQEGEPVVAGQFVDKSDGEIFDFQIKQSTNTVNYKSTGGFLDQTDHGRFFGGDGQGTGTTVEPSVSDSEESGLRPYELLLAAIEDQESEAYQSPFAEKLRKDLDFLGGLTAAMYQGNVSIEAQPLYTGLHRYAIKYAFSGLSVFSETIASLEGAEAGAAADAWVQEHGHDFASAVVKEFSARRCARFQESIESEDQQVIQELTPLIEEALGMGMATTADLIRTVGEADGYQDGDVQTALAAAIEEYCPIDNSDGYSTTSNARLLAAEWQEVVTRSGCQEDLSMEALGLPQAESIAPKDAESKSGDQNHQEESIFNEPMSTDGNDVFYVNVGEGPHRNWDDCRQFGFLAAGGGRKWSKQLEKIKAGDTVIAYLKGYGYVGIGKVTSTATQATKFMVKSVPIKELPLVNDTIRSIKRFSKENGEYLIGVDWQVAVPRDQAAWRPSSGLYTTALVCASLRNQPVTTEFVFSKLLGSPSPGHRETIDSESDHSGVTDSDGLMPPLSHKKAISWLKAALLEAEEQDVDTDEVLVKLTDQEWVSDDEFLDFFTEISLELAQSASREIDQETAAIFGKPIYYGLSLGSPYYTLWEQAYKTKSPRLSEMINIQDWNTSIASEVEELGLIMMIPLAAAYEQPIFEGLRNRSVVDPSEAEEAFFGYVAASLTPGYFDGAIPPEILNVPSARVLCEILEDWSLYRDLWVPSTLSDLLSSADSTRYVTMDVCKLIRRVLKGESPFELAEWDLHRQEYWDDEEVQEVLGLCGGG